MSPHCESVVKPLAGEEENEKERDEARQNVGDNEEDHKRRKILLKEVTCLAWVEQPPSLPEWRLRDTDARHRGPPWGRGGGGAVGGQVGQQMQHMAGGRDHAREEGDDT